ncbi:MAG TPA: hypothetical protein VF665_00250 [Longimicrobium sp.]|jgi:hypothetical protein|uniref:hypothetical protein n=1 Tax=Longimicrobium sp. TaxID=2029185 RepID=UPI002EDA76B1
MKHRWIALAALMGAAVAPAARAQVFTPTYMSPVPRSDFGVYVHDWGPDALGVEGIWRRPSRGGSDLGLRAGYVDTGDGALTLGLEVRNPVVLAGAPIGLAFTAGAQGVVGDGTSILGGQVGFTAGQPIPAGNFTVTPYIHPRLAIANDIIGDRNDEDDIQIDVLADVGLDLEFTSGITFRFGANLGRGADWGLGFAWRQ